VNKNFFLINVLPSESYADCHIKGSISVPLEKLEEFAQKLDKNAEIVVYCARYACPLSKKAWKLLKKLGFVNIKAYEGGILEWHQTGLATEGSCKSDFLSGPKEQPTERDPEVVTISLDELKKKLT
jgi:rhodanese-related sulfurtransferase